MDAKTLIDSLGGVAAVAAATGDGLKAVSMWKTRNAIPACRHVAVWRLAQQRGVHWTPPGAEGCTLVQQVAA